MPGVKSNIEETIYSRINAGDSTHGLAISSSVGKALLKLNARYFDSTWVVERTTNKPLIIAEEIKTDASDDVLSTFLDRIKLEGLLRGEKVITLAEGYATCRQEMFNCLENVSQGIIAAGYTELASRLLEKLGNKRKSENGKELPAVFDEEFEPRVFFWEFVNNIYDEEIEENTLAVFPFHYVFVLLWKALHDHEQYKHNYEGDEGEQIEQAKADLPNRLLTFFNVLDKNIGGNICSHGIRNLLVLCLNKIDVDVDLIEDIQASALSFIGSSLSDSLLTKINTYQQRKEASSDLSKLQKALIAWMLSDIGDFSELKASSFLEVNLMEGIIARFSIYLKSHGIDPQHKDVRVGLESVCNMIPFDLIFSEEKAPTLYASNLILSKNEVEELSETLSTLSQYRADKRLSQPLKDMAARIQGKDCDFLSNKSHQQDIIQFSKVYQCAESLIKHRFLLILTGQMSAEDIDTKFEVLRISLNRLANQNLVEEGVFTDLDIVEKTVKNAKNNGEYVAIENFFSTWFFSQESNPQGRLAHYKPFLEPSLCKKIGFSDEELTQLLIKKQDKYEPDIANFGSYEINRLFLHALLTNPHEWSKTFITIFKEVYLLARYPVLLNQLAYYLALAEGQDEAPPRPNVAEMILFPSSGQVNDGDSLLILLSYFFPDARDRIEKKYKEILITLIGEIGGFYELMQKVETDTEIQGMFVYLQLVVTDKVELLGRLRILKNNFFLQNQVVSILQHKLKLLITDKVTFMELLEILAGNDVAQATVLGTLKDSLKEFIVDTFSLQELLDVLGNAEVQLWVIKRLQNDLKVLITDKNSFVELLRVLENNDPAQELVIDSLEASLKVFIRSKVNLIELLQELDEIEIEPHWVQHRIISALEGELNVWFTNKDDWLKLLIILKESPLAQEIVINALKDKLPEFTLKENDLVELLGALKGNSLVQELVVENLKDALIGFFKDTAESDAVEAFGKVLAAVSHSPNALYLVAKELMDSFVWNCHKYNGLEQQPAVIRARQEASQSNLQFQQAMMFFSPSLPSTFPEVGNDSQSRLTWERLNN